MSNECEKLQDTMDSSAPSMSDESITGTISTKTSISDGMKPVNSDLMEESMGLTAAEFSQITVACNDVATTVIEEVKVKGSTIQFAEATVVESQSYVAKSNSGNKHSVSQTQEIIDSKQINEDETSNLNEVVILNQYDKPQCLENDDKSNVNDQIVTANSSCRNNEIKAEHCIELPSIGILVEDDNAGTCDNVTNLKTSKDNSSIRKVSAKVSLEPLQADVPKPESSSKPIVPLKTCPEERNSHDEPNQEILPSEEQEKVTPSSDVEACSDIPQEGAVTIEETRKKSACVSPTCTALKLAPSDIEHKVKRIKFMGKEVPIITQNNNGPCPLLAILNALLLRGEVELGVSGPVVKGGHLVGVVANALIDLAPPGSATPQLLHNIHQNTDDAVQILDKLLTGLDVNVKFSGVQDFEFTNELCVFDGVRVNLYHGWVVDPEWPSAEVVRDLSYNQLTNNILTWRHEAGDQADNWLLMKAVLCEEFLHCSSSQLTVHGLFVLGSTMQEGEMAVLFRNNHFSTIYKHKDHLYQLLTDLGFLTEAATWQTLSDVDASFSEFVTESFEPWQLRPVVATPSSPPPAFTEEQQINTDKELAAALQKESDQMCHNEEDFSQMVQQFEWNDGLSDEELARRLQQEEVREAEAAAAGNQSRGGGATAQLARGTAATGSRPSSPPAPPPPHTSPRDQAKKKKDQCCIL